MSLMQQFTNEFNKIDIYGVGFNLRYNQNSIFQSNFGAAVTILIGALVFIQLYFSSLDLIEKRNPEVIQSEIYQPNPTSFEMNKDTFNFSVGVQYPGNFTHFIDESVYELYATQISVVKKYNDQLGQFEQIWSRVNVPMRACQYSNFGVNETSTYFENLANIKSMYCVDKEDQNLFIQGNYDQDTYALIRLEFRLCSGKPYCRDPTEITEILTHSYVAIYMSDVIVNPGELKPFKYIGKDIFWNNSPQITRDIDIYFRNVVMESDEGVLLSDTNILKATQFSYQTESIIFDEDKYFFAMQLRFEKQKETHYQRKYKKLDRLLAEIGGISKALVMIGFLITYPFNKLKLSEKLINDLFNFEEQILKKRSNSKATSNNGKLVTRGAKRSTLKQTEFNGQVREIKMFDDIKENTSKQQSLVSLDFPDHEKKHSSPYNFEKKHSSSPYNFQQKHSSSPYNYEKNEEKSGGRKQTNLQTVLNLRDVNSGDKQQSLLSTKNILVNQSQVRTFNDEKLRGHHELLDQSMMQGKFKLSWSQYIRYYVWPWGNFSKVKNYIEEIISQVYHHLDIIQIIKHQIEFEKVKALLFDEDQIKLLQFLPKPTIRLDCLDGVNQQHIENGEQDHSKLSKENKPITSIYYKKRVSEVQEKQEAIDALAKLVKKKDLSNIDRKLIRMIEQNKALDKIYNYDINQSEYKGDIIHLQGIEQDLPVPKSMETSLTYLQTNKKQAKIKVKNKKLNIETLQPSHSLRDDVKGENNLQGEINHSKDSSITNTYTHRKPISFNQNNDLASLPSSFEILDFQFIDIKRGTNGYQDGSSKMVPSFTHNLGQQNNN